MRSIPVVSLAGDPQDVAAAVGAACRDVGFLVVIDHGIDQGVVDEALAQAQRFFALPPERKQELADTGIEDRGWFPMGGQSLDPGSPYDLSEYVMLGHDLGRLRSEVQYSDVEEVLEDDLGVYLGIIEAKIRHAAEAVELTYFRSSDELSLHVLDSSTVR